VTASVGARVESVGARLLGAFGACCCALAVVLGAVAAHATAAASRPRLETAVLYLFLHGLGLLLLAPRLRGRLGSAAGLALATGTLLFCGTLAMAALAGGTTAPAPFGGGLLIAGWLLVALHAWRG
jgi:uncharacterized membrane protein YgdD (TMEM256/DUF423 family)